MKVSLGEYSAFEGRGGPRFMIGTKLVSEGALPLEVAQELRKMLGAPSSTTPKTFPMPTEEEKIKLREDSLRVKDELKLTPEETEARAHPIETEEIIPVEEALVEQVPVGAPDADFLETVSIYSASIQDIFQALSDRFGIYSVYLGRVPLEDEVNPLTGEQFTKYHLGIAYQAALRAITNGFTDPEKSKATIDAGRYASEHFQEQFVPIPYTMGQAREQSSFDYRTSVKGANESPDGVSVNGAVSRAPRGDEDEPILEPPFTGKPIIRPNW